MSKKKYIEEMSKEEFSKFVKSSSSKRELYAKLGVHENGTYSRLIKQKLNQCELTLKHNQLVYPWITKTCPACGDEFKTQKGAPKEKVVCSPGCANTHFRSGPDHPNWKTHGSEGAIRSTCFHYHKKKCIICDESNIVAVHHYDHNRTNNEPSNLIPMCPTHHQYHHSNFKEMVDTQIDAYRKSWLLENQD